VLGQVAKIECNHSLSVAEFLLNSNPPISFLYAIYGIADQFELPLNGLFFLLDLIWIRKPFDENASKFIFDEDLESWAINTLEFVNVCHGIHSSEMTVIWVNQV
jgi:hypothetical protein